MTGSTSEKPVRRTGNDRAPTVEAFGPVIEREGITLLPVVRARRRGPDRVIGAWVVSDRKAEWQPAFDLTLVIVTSNAVALVALLVLRRLVSRRAAQG